MIRSYMTKISIFSWNVHNLRDEAHAKRVVAHIRQSDPDIFGLAEVIGESAYQYVAKEFPDHNFYMTYGRQSQEMLIGVRITQQVFFSQKTEFQSGNTFLRPAALVTIMGSDNPLNILFVHPKSFQQPLDLGLRDDFFRRVCSLKQKLDEKAKGGARFIVCGDMNIMGMHYMEKFLIKEDDEFVHVSNELGDCGLLCLDKSTHSTYYGGRRVADLDHVFVSGLVIPVKQQDGDRRFEVSVRGWNQYPDGSVERKEFIENVSDHCALYFEVDF